ncbi:MAG: hypothetical protein GXP44_03260 [bacterium]|nr:hypothetical protein [bacterium]
MRKKPKYNAPCLVVYNDETWGKMPFLILKKRYGRCNDSPEKKWWYSGVLFSLAPAGESYAHSVPGVGLRFFTNILNVPEEKIFPIQ